MLGIRKLQTAKLSLLDLFNEEELRLKPWLALNHLKYQEPVLRRVLKMIQVSIFPIRTKETEGALYLAFTVSKARRGRRLKPLH